MSFIKNKEQSLKQLRDFCSRNKVYGWCSNMWYHGLKNAYPLEFLNIQLTILTLEHLQKPDFRIK